MSSSNTLLAPSGYFHDERIPESNPLVMMLNVEEGTISKDPVLQTDHNMIQSACGNHYKSYQPCTDFNSLNNNNNINNLNINNLNNINNRNIESNRYDFSNEKILFKQANNPYLQLNASNSNYESNENFIGKTILSVQQENILTKYGEFLSTPQNVTDFDEKSKLQREILNQDSNDLNNQFFQFSQCSNVNSLRKFRRSRLERPPLKARRNLALSIQVTNVTPSPQKKKGFDLEKFRARAEEIRAKKKK